MKFEPLYKVRPLTDLKQMLEESVHLFADRDAFLLKKDNVYRHVTYKEFRDDVMALGTALYDLGLYGKHIAIIGENRYEWALSYLATINGTGIAVPMDKELPDIEIENLLKRSSSAAVIFTNKNKKEILAMADRLPNIKYFINMDSDENTNSIQNLLAYGKKLVDNGNDNFIKSKINPYELSVLLYTSGTTDMAKAIMLSHHNICSNITSVCATIYLDCNDSVLSILPMHHTYECTVGLLVMIYNGCRISFAEGLKQIPKNLKEFKPTILILVPLIIESVHKRIWDVVSKKPIKKHLLRAALNLSKMLISMFNIDLRKIFFKEIHENLGGNVRLIISGAAAINPDISSSLRSLGITILQGYGLTECSPIVSVNRMEDYRDASAGQPLPGVEVMIADPGPDGIGEIATKSQCVMLGYYENEEATRNVIRDGWFYTGDLGKMDKDGFIYITGRKKNVIVTKNGKNIFPEEIEAKLNKSPYIIESLVFGEMDEEQETIITAQVLPDIAAISLRIKIDNPTDDDIRKVIKAEIKSINRSLPLFKRIKDFSIRETEFIKTTTKKIKRYAQN